MVYPLCSSRGTAAQARRQRVRTIDALRRWEPRVVKVSAELFFDRDRLLFVNRVRYDVIRRNGSANQVIFPDVTQDVLLPVGLPPAT